MNTVQSGGTYQLVDSSVKWFTRRDSNPNSHVQSVLSYL